MRNVLFTALIVAVVTTTTWAQTPAAPAPPAAPARVTTGARQAPPAPAAPATAAPATVGARQGAPPAPAAPAAAAPVAPAPPPGSVQSPRYPNPPRNVRFEIVITETGTAKPSTKTVSLTVNDGGGSGSVRNGGNSAATLNVDVRGVQAFEGGAVRATIGVEYQPWVPDASSQLSSISSGITSMFQDGRRMQILQTADPLSDRRTTIEVLMTVLK